MADKLTVETSGVGSASRESASDDAGAKERAADMMKRNAACPHRVKSRGRIASVGQRKHAAVFRCLRAKGACEKRKK